MLCIIIIIIIIIISSSINVYNRITSSNNTNNKGAGRAAVGLPLGLVHLDKQMYIVCIHV